MNEDFYFRLFEVDTDILHTLVSKAMSTGADYADLYFEYSSYRDITLKDSAVSSGSCNVDYGVGIRAVKDEHTGYSYCENTVYDNMLLAAKAAASISSGAPASFQPSCHPQTGVCCPRGGLQGGNYYKQEEKWENCPVSRQAAYLKELENALRSRDSRIDKVIARISSSESHILMFNSLGELSFDTRPMGSISASIIFSDGKTVENRSASRSFRSGCELLGEKVRNEIIEDLVCGMDNSLKAVRPKGGRMPVVMGAGASGILLHEAMGHAFEADFNRKGQSVFSGRIGERVCPKGINIVDDATLYGNRGACNFDDEGVPGKKSYMVTDGILTSYLHDRISARHYGVEPTGNGRRESFRFNPIPRMRLTYMENGDADPGSIIASVNKGIYVDEFSNGQVKIGEGDFTFYVKSGYLIENGALTEPIKDINIIGNGPRALSDIAAVGNDLKIDNGRWTCGKEQSVPVGCGMPTVLVKELTVGGE